MKNLSEYILEAVKADNGEPWLVYVDDKLDNHFTEWAKKWKKKPQIGHGWYAGGTVFKIVKIDNNEVYTKTE